MATRLTFQEGHRKSFYSFINEEVLRIKKDEVNGRNLEVMCCLVFLVDEYCIHVASQSKKEITIHYMRRMNSIPLQCFMKIVSTCASGAEYSSVSCNNRACFVCVKNFMRFSGLIC
jgi:hypothetical protein